MTDTGRERALADAAMAALRQGDAQRALATLRNMQEPPPMLLAQACNRSGDVDGEAAARGGGRQGGASGPPPDPLGTPRVPPGFPPG